jgi:cysteinyl-tRNA synthetase
MAVSGALTGKPLARDWILCEPVLSGGRKADWDAAIPNIVDLLEQGYSGRVIRYWFLSNHYRKPLTLSYEALDQAERAVHRLDACISLLHNVDAGSPYPDLDQLLYDMKTGVADAMDDDLNVPSAMATIFQTVRRVNRLAMSENLDQAGARRILEAFRRVNAVLNILEEKQKLREPDIKKLLIERSEARRRKDWKRADQIRDRLVAMGVEVRDTKAS